MKNRIEFKKHEKMFLNICLIFVTIFIFQSCKPNDEKKSSTSSSTAQAQVVISNSLNYVNSSNFQLTFDVKGITSTNLLSVTCQLNNELPKSCITKTAQFNLVADGSYTIKIVVQPKIGKKVEFSKIIIKDSTAPVLSVSAQPSVATSLKTANFSFSVSDNFSGVSSLECSLDGSIFQACIPPVSLSNLNDGSHIYKIWASDKAGNVSAVYSYAWTIDQSVPTISFNQTPNANANLINASFGFSGVGITAYECKVDNGVYSSCTSPVSLTSLTNGSHTFSVKGVNAAGTMSSPLVYNWSVDNVAPTNPTITSTVDANTNITAAQFSFASTDSGSGIAKFQCAIDGDSYSNCSTPKVLDYVSQGSHLFKVIAFDTAGNVSSASQFAWVVDSVAPTTPILAANVQLYTKLDTAQMTFSSTDSGTGVDHYECALDSVTYSACTSPTNLSALAPGAHQFKVKAIDKNANVSSAATFSWTIDLAGPSISFTQTPSKVFVGSRSEFAFQVTDLAGIASVKCSWMNPALVSTPVDCISGTVGFNLEPEAYTLKIEATDNAGNVSIKNYSWDVDDGVGSILKLKSISSNGAQSCGITFDNKIKCWGFGVENNNFVASSIAIEKFSIVGINSITVEYYNVCVLLNDKSVYCSIMNVPGVNRIIDNVKELRSGAYHTCALLETGIVKCWGGNWDKQLGDGSSVNESNTPVEVSGVTNAKSLFVGYNESCVIQIDDKAKCWGKGQSTAQFRPELNGFKSISLSLNQSCGITNSDELKCWMSTNPPSSIEGISKVKSVSTNESHACAITESNKVVCFGWGTNLLGNLDASFNNYVVEVLGLDQSKMISTGHVFSCAINADDNVKCWGLNHQGQLGFSNSSLSITHKEIPGLTNAKLISRSDMTKCVLLNSGNVKCWGEDSTGDGLRVASEIPQLITGLNNVKDLSISYDLKCAQHNDDTVSCWGPNSPHSKISGITGVKSVETSYNSACAIMSNGTVKCWGKNDFNNLGVEAIESSEAPVLIPGLSNIIKVASGTYNNCALDGNGDVKCWGLGIGRTPVSFTQLANYKFKKLTGSIQNSYCGTTLTNEQVCFNINGLNNIYFSTLQTPTMNPLHVSVYNTYENCFLSEQFQVYCAGDNAFGKLAMNWTFPVFPEYQYSLMTTPKPVINLATEYNKNYFIYSDNTVGFVGSKYYYLKGASAILKDPR